MKNVLINHTVSFILIIRIDYNKECEFIIYELIHKFSVPGKT